MERGNKMEEVSFITFCGKEILQVRFEQGEDIIQIDSIAREVKRIVSGQPPGSLLILTIVRDFDLTPNILLQFKELMIHNKPHVKASALVGLVDDKIRFFDSLGPETERHIQIFDDTGTAKRYLVSVE